MYNKKAISDALANLNKAKAPKQEPDIIYSPRGQWDHPGEVTRVPSENITMQGVHTPLLGIDNMGNQQMMYPGAEYTFPGADYVDEYPMMQKGGQRATIYVDPNDPEGRARHQSYQDSLALYNYSNQLIREGLGYESFSFPENPELYKDYNIPYNPTGTTLNLNNEVYKIGVAPGEDGHVGINYRDIVEESLKTKNKPLGWTYSDASIPVYKKPVEPIKYKPNPEIVAKQQQLIDAGFNIGKADGIWGPKSKAAWEEFQNKSNWRNNPKVPKEKPVVYTDDPNDPRIQAYIDKVRQIDEFIKYVERPDQDGASSRKNEKDWYLDPVHKIDWNLQPVKYREPVKEEPVKEDDSFIEETPTITLPKKDKPKGLTRQVPKTTTEWNPQLQMYVPVTRGGLDTVEDTGVDIGGRKLRYGGLTTGLTNTKGNLLMNNKGKRMMAKSGSLSATNELFLGNPLVTKRKRAVFVPGHDFQEGGAIELELTPEEIEQYKKEGYIIEELPKAQEGDEIITDKGWDYKKKDDQYLTKKTGTENWITAKGNALEAIKTKIYKENLETVPTEENIQKPIIDQTANNIPTPPSESIKKPKESFEEIKDGYLPTFLGKDKEEKCIEGVGCSGNVSRKMLNMFGSLEKDLQDFKANESLWTKNAWFNRDFQEKMGGKLLYSTEERGGPDKIRPLPKELYSKLQVGDYVHLDRKGSGYDYLTDKDGYTNEKIEHIGFIIGKDSDGTPLVWHGSESGQAYIQRVDEKITLPGVIGELQYGIASIVRNKDLANADQNVLKKALGDNPYYRDLDSEIDKDLKLKIDATSSSTYQKDAVNIINNNLKDFLKIGYNQDDVLYAAQVLIGGVLSNESDNADWSSLEGTGKQLKRKGKESAAILAKNILGVSKEFEKDEASRGVYQLKPNLNFTKGTKPYSNLNQLGIKKDDMFNNTENETKAAMLLMLDNYDKLKEDPRFDSEKNGIVIDDKFFPASYILSKSWQAGHGWYDREKHKPYLLEYDTDYSNSALNASSNIKLTKDSIKDINKDADYVFRKRAEKIDPQLKADQIALKNQKSENLNNWFNQRDSESTFVNSRTSTPNLDFLQTLPRTSDPVSPKRGLKRISSDQDPFRESFNESGEDLVVKSFPRFKTSQEDLEEMIQLEKEGYKLIKKGDQIYATVKLLPGLEIKANRQQGGAIELELTDDEIQWYKSQGYNVEEL